MTTSRPQDPKATVRPPASPTRPGYAAAPTVVVGVHTDASDDLPAVPADRVGAELSRRAPWVTWSVRALTGSDAMTAGRDEHGVPVAGVLARGRTLLLAADVDVAVVVTGTRLLLHGRPVESHTSPVQQTAVLYADPARRDDLPADVACVVLDLLDVGETPDDLERLRQLAAPGDGHRGAVAALRTVAANLALLASLVAANRPWLLALHLTRALVGAGAAAFVAVVTPDFWLLADRMGVGRLAAVSVVALVAACCVLVYGGRLREHAPNRAARRAVLLHNAAVWTSVVIGVLALFVVLVVATVVVTMVVLPWSLVAQTVGHDVDWTTMLRLGVLVGIVSLVGSVFGAGLEDDDDVHAAAYTGSDDARFIDED